MRTIGRSLLFLLLAQLSLFAQLNVGSITGTVHDASGAVVPAVKVVATNTGTGLTEEVTTNASGVYVVKLLPIGNYTLTVSQPGFQKFERTDIQVVSSETVSIDVALAVGQVTQTITVTGAAALLDTQTSNVGTSRTAQEISELPVTLYGNSSRTAVALARTTAGVVYDPGESGGQEFMVFSRSQINGQAPGTWGYNIDGVESSNGDRENASDFSSPVPDVVQEVRITSNTDVSQGFSGGVNFAVTLKSGGNKLHGDFYNYIRNDLTEARNTLLPKVPEDKQDNGGFVLSGPVVIPHVYNGKDKTFFMVNMDFYRWRTTIGGVQAAIVGSVPTNLQRQGDFTESLGAQIGTDALNRPIYKGEIYNPSTTRADGLGGFIRDPYMYNGQLNVVNPALFSPVSQAYLAHIHAATTTGTVNNWVGPSNQFRVDKDQLYTKFDEIINARHRFSLAWERTMPWFIKDKGLKTGFSGHAFVDGGVGWLDSELNTGFIDDRDQYRVRLNEVSTISPNLLFSFRAAVTRSPNRVVGRFPFTGGNTTFGALTGIKGVLSPATPYVSVEGINSFGGPWSFNTLYTGLQETPFSVDFSWSKGTHNFKFGSDFIYNVYSNLTDNGSMGNFSFTNRITGMPGLTTTGQGAASFLTGWLDTATVQSPLTTQTRSSAFGLFVQDSWRITPKLTLNYGLRWNVYPPGWEHKDRYSTFDPTLINPATGTKGALAFYGQGAGRNGLHRLAGFYLGAFAPQLGFAYSLNPKTVVRGFAGLSYGPYNTQKYIGSNAAAAPSDGYTIAKTVGGLDNGVTSPYNWNNPFPLGFPATYPVIDPTLDNNQGISFWDRHDNRPYRITNTSFEVARELPGQMTVKVTYVGTFGHGLVVASPYDLNAPPLSALSLGNLLTQDINSPAARAAGIPIPYAGFTGPVVQALRPYPQFRGIQCDQCQVGYSSYNAAQFNVQKRFGEGLTFLANYTVSKSIASENGIWGGSPSVRHPSLWPQDSHQILQGKDRPWNLNLSWVYQLPFGTGKHFLRDAKGPLNKVVGGWQLTAIQNYFGGAAFQVNTEATNPVAGAWPVLQPGVPIKASSCSGNSSVAPFLNVNAFKDPAPFSIGNYSYLTNVRTCGYGNEDFELTKTIPIRESLRFQIGTMWTNAFNRVAWNDQGAFGTDIDIPAAFGKYTVAYPSRNIQFYTRLEW